MRLERGVLTKISCAERDLDSECDDMALGETKGCSPWSKKGLRETGRAIGAGSSKGDSLPISMSAGEAARLRNGLLEDRLMLRWASSPRRLTKREI